MKMITSRCLPSCWDSPKGLAGRCKGVLPVGTLWKGRVLPGRVGSVRIWNDREMKIAMCKIKKGIFLFSVILMMQMPLSASAGNPPQGTGLPGTGGAETQTEEPGGEGFPGDKAVTGDVTPGDMVPPGDLVPGDLAPGDWMPGDITEPGDMIPSEGTEGQEPTGSSSRTGVLPVVCMICVAAAVVAVGIAVWAVLRKRGGGTSRKARVSQKAGSGIPIQLEVYAGRCRNQTALLELSDCLTIGSSAGCDILFDDPEVAPLHSRIRLTGDQVYIEDLGSPHGTALDGMRIQGQNRLRGGEIISIGPVEFSITFLQNA